MASRWGRVCRMHARCPWEPRTPGRVSGGVFGRVGRAGPWNFSSSESWLRETTNGGRRAPVVLSFHTDGVMPARNRDVHTETEHGRTVTPPALVTIECRGPDGMPAVVVHRIVVSGASRQYRPDAADESSSTASLDRRVSPPERSSDDFRNQQCPRIGLGGQRRRAGHRNRACHDPWHNVDSRHRDRKNRRPGDP